MLGRKPLILLVLTFGMSSHPCFSAPLQDLPSAVPLEIQRQAASDLVYDGVILQPDQARELVAKGKIKSLADLDPQEDSIIWSPAPKIPTQSDYAQLELHESGELVRFVALDAAPSGRLMFIAQKQFPDGRVRAYRFLIDDKGHNMLARKALLRKIGYQVPPMERIAGLRVRFKGAFSKREFVRNQLKKRVYKDAIRWLDSDPDSEDEFLDLKDLIVLDNTRDSFYNLARGNISEGVIQGRRLINSLLLPYSLTDAPESIPLMSWTGAQIINQQILFPYEYGEFFKPSLDDAVWMARRILKLTQQDWEEIADSARMPSEPRLLFLEKLKARRNYYREILKLQSESGELPVNYKPTLGDRLVDGRLVGGREWPTYARRFKGIDPDSPLSMSEVFGLVASKTLSNVISNAVAEFNLRYMPRTDLGYKIFDHQLDVAAAQFAEFLKTGKVSKTPLGVWKTPFFNTDVITSREIITGDYKGSDNQIQLVDTVGLSVEGGTFYLGEGLSDKLVASARLRVRWYITYSHIKPIFSMKASLKEPLANILVPYAKSQVKAPLEGILALEAGYRDGSLKGDDFKKALQTQFDEFGKMLKVGESYVITTSLMPGIDLSLGKGITADARAYLKMQEQLVGVSRINIWRKDEDTVQVYVDDAGFNDFAIAVGLNVRIPVLDLGFRWPAGVAQTQLFTFNIDRDLKKNPDFFNQVTGILSAISGADVSHLRNFQTPWLFNHDFSTRRTNFDLLVWKNVWDRTRIEISAVEPVEGQTAQYVRRSRGKRFGIEYQQLMLDVTNAIIAEKYPTSTIRIESTNTGNPGDTIFGKSITRQVIADARVVKGPIDLNNHFAAVGYRWKGWQMSRKGLDEVLDEIDEKYGRGLFQRPDFSETTELQLYTIELQSAIYRRGIERILKISDKEVRDIFKQYGRPYPQPSGEVSMETENPWVVWMQGDLKDLRRAYAYSDNEEFSQELSEIIDVAESQLTFEGFKQFIGGQNNFFLRGLLKGFRVGAENGAEDIRPITLGEIGSFEPNGPLYTLQSNTGISTGELLLYWLVNPL